MSSSAPTPASSTRPWLLALARASLAEQIGVPFQLPPEPADSALSMPARVFVSWHLDGPLVGCMGTLEPRATLVDAVRHFAIQSGLHDPRSPGVQPDQFERLRCEVSILSDSLQLDVQGLAAIAQVIKPGDGVIVRLWSHKAIFLPVVWGKIPGVDAFLGALCRKGGIDPERDGDKVSAWTFSTETFGDLPEAGGHGTPTVR